MKIRKMAYLMDCYNCGNELNILDLNKQVTCPKCKYRMMPYGIYLKLIKYKCKECGTKIIDFPFRLNTNSDEKALNVVPLYCPKCEKEEPSRELYIKTIPNISELQKIVKDKLIE